MTHAQKIRLARQMITLQEIRARVPLFSSLAWRKRKFAKRLKAIKQYRKVEQPKTTPQVYARREKVGTLRREWEAIKKFLHL